MSKTKALSSTEEKNEVVPQAPKPSGVNEQALQERQLLSGLLIQGADHRAEAEARKRKQLAEEIELLSGQKITLEKIRDVVTGLRQPYEPMFGNGIDFFRELYRLLGWTDKDPNSFNKPAIVGDYFNQLLYARFHQDVQPALHALAVPGGIRRDKFFQYLTPAGHQKLLEYRDQAIALMKECTSWYEFRVKYGKKYGLPVQKVMFEAYQDN